MRIVKEAEERRNEILDVAEMTLLYSDTVFDDLVQHSEEAYHRKIAAFIYNLERLLGMESGSMQAAILPIFQKDDLKGGV